jgi:DNA-binding transcriptional LysR family regulator
MDPSSIELFASVVELGGVRAAAQKLGLARSSVSRALAELEAKLGVRLLERSTRAMKVTEAGALLLERARPALVMLADAESAVRALKKRPTGTLKIAAPPLVAEQFLPSVLERYGRRYPEVKLDLRLDDAPVSLVDEGIDCAIRTGPLSDSSLVARRLGAGSGHVYASPDYLASRGEPSHPLALSEHDTIVFTGRRQPNRWVFEAGDERIVVNVVPKHRVNSLLLARDLCRASLGIAHLPTFIARDSAHRGELRELMPDFPSPAASMYVVYPNARLLAPKTQAFIELLTSYFATIDLSR